MEVNSRQVPPEEALSAVLQWLCNPRGGNNFYARALNGCGKQKMEGLRTCAVSIAPTGRYVFLYDPIWYSKQEPEFQLLVVIHEIAHVILRHLERGLTIRNRMENPEKFTEKLRYLLNIAQDMAANDTALRPMMNAYPSGKKFEQFRDRIIWPESRNYPVGKSMEEYFLLLLQDTENTKEEEYTLTLGISSNGSSSGSGVPADVRVRVAEIANKKDNGISPEEQVDDAVDEDKGKDVPKWVKELAEKVLTKPIDWEGEFDKMTSIEIDRTINRAKKEVQKIVKTAVEQTERSHGKVPGEIQSQVTELLKEPSIAWQRVLMGLIKSNISSKLDESTSQPNSSYLHLEDDGFSPYPGYQHNFTFNLAILVDTSGSVSDHEFTEFLSEIKGLVKAEEGISARLIMFDAAIQHEEIIDGENTTEFNRYMYRYGYGGTSFVPPLKYACGCDEPDDWDRQATRVTQRMSNPDLVLLFTDGYAPIASPHGPVPQYLPSCPLMWVLTPSGQEDPLMQPRVLRIAQG